MDSNKKPVILWAVDPLSGEWKAQRGAAKAIAALTAKYRCLVQPVYVAANPLANLPQGFTVEVFEGVREKGQDRFNEMIEGTSLESVAPLKIIQVKNLSTTERITELLAYAQGIHPELIVVGTRARKGAPRWFFGSFAESLSLRSDIPLLVVNPSWNPPVRPTKGKAAFRGFKKILFPTDFSDASHEAFREVIRFSKTTGAAVQLFHKHYSVAAPVWNSPLEVKLSYREIVEDGLKESKRRAEVWVNEAKSQGVYASAKIDSGPGESTVDAILKQIKDPGVIIAMAAQSSQLDVRLMGSVTRKLIRSAANPVWVLHSHSKNLESVQGQQGAEGARIKSYEDRESFKFPKVM